MISTSNFQEWKNVARQDWRRKTWSRDPTTVALRVWNFEKLTRKVVFLFSFRKWNPQKYVARSKWGRATVGFYKRITGRVANWRRAYQSPCWTHCAVWSWSKEKTPPWIVLIWSTLHDDGSIFGLPPTQTVLLLSVFPSRSLPDRPFGSKECKNRGFQPQAFVP